MPTPESILAFPSGVLTLADSGDKEKPHRLTFVGRDGRTFSNTYAPVGYSELMKAGPERVANLMDAAAGDVTHDLSALEQGVVQLAAERCVDSRGYVDEEKVARFASDRGLGYSAARDLVTRALNGDDAEDDGYPMIQAFAKAHGLPFTDAASELADVGALDGGGGASVGSVSVAARPAEEITHERIVAELSARDLDMSHYGDVAYELAAELD